MPGRKTSFRGVKFILKNLQAAGKESRGSIPRPFGLYVNLSEDPVQSPVTVMVPMVDQDQFIAMLKERLDITPEKVEGEVLKIDLPEAAKNPVIVLIYVRFANEYMYVARSAADLDAKGLIAPKTYFAKDDAGVGLDPVRGDGSRRRSRHFHRPGRTQHRRMRRRKNAANENPSEKAFLDWLTDVGVGGLKAFLDESKEFNVRIFIDEKADEMSAEVVALTPRTGTAMARYIASLGKQMSIPAGIVSADGRGWACQRENRDDSDLRQGFGKVIDEVMADALRKVNEPEKESVEWGVQDAAHPPSRPVVSMWPPLPGPDAKGKHTPCRSA